MAVQVRSGENEAARADHRGRIVIHLIGPGAETVREDYWNRGCTVSGHARQARRRTGGPQDETAAEREAEEKPANQQDLDKPPEGRDVPPAKPVKKGLRDPDSPWMGGG
jgi:hypothetical protein